MSGQYAIIDSAGNIQNAILWDGKSAWRPQEGFTAIACNKDECMIGGSFINGMFLSLKPEQFTSEELLDKKLQQKNKLLDEVGVKIAVLQDAISLGMVTDNERVLLTELQKYRVILSRIDVSATLDINWPVMPA